MADETNEKTSMVDRIARVIFERRWPERNWAEAAAIGPLGDYGAGGCREAAIAILKVLSEPTQAMLDAGSDNMAAGIDYSPEEGEGIDGYNATPVWDAMIAAALTERSET